jgi:hypothetical protein
MGTEETTKKSLPEVCSAAYNYSDKRNNKVVFAQNVDEKQIREQGSQLEDEVEKDGDRVL